MIELEGIKLSPEMIEIIKDWQTGYLESSIEFLDDAITFIAREESSTSPEEVRKSLNLIRNICALKEEIKTFKTK